MGTGTAPSEMTAFLAALAISGWAFIGFDACSTTAEETHEPKRMVPRAIFMSLMVVGTVVLFNSAALILAFEHDTLRHSSHTSDPVTPLIASSIGEWFEMPFLAIVMTAFLACGASMVKYTSRIVYSMARRQYASNIKQSYCQQNTAQRGFVYRFASRLRIDFWTQR